MPQGSGPVRCQAGAGAGQQSPRRSVECRGRRLAEQSAILPSEAANLASTLGRASSLELRALTLGAIPTLRMQRAARHGVQAHCLGVSPCRAKGVMITTLGGRRSVQAARPGCAHSHKETLWENTKFWCKSS